MVDLELKVAEFYANKLLSPVKRGESAVAVWFPGSGRSTTLRNIFKNRALLKKNLGGLVRNLKILFVNCDAIFSSTAEEAFESMTEGKNNLAKWAEEIVEKGDEILVVLDGTESLPEPELSKLLVRLAALVSISPRRIHCLINVNDKPLLEKLYLTKPSLSILIQNFIYLPVLSGKLLEECLSFYENQFSQSLSPTVKKSVIKLTGGILRLTKEYFRNGGITGDFDLKLKAVWQWLPQAYREILLKEARGEKIASEIDQKRADELKKMGVLGSVNIFKEKYYLLSENPSQDILKRLSETEQEVLKIMQKNKGSLITKEQIAGKLWGENYEDKYSDWAIDQFISRLRKKIIKAGFIRDSLVTVKGRGYKWLAK